MIKGFALESIHEKGTNFLKRKEKSFVLASVRTAAPNIRSS